MMDYIQEEQETLVEILQGFVPKKVQSKIPKYQLLLIQAE